jgi:multidrug efflux pump subunit AcrA (membrane-fusion protein)
VGRAEEVVNQEMLRSPIDGVVTERLFVRRAYQNEQSPVLTLAQIDPLRAEVFVPTGYYKQIRIGTRAEIRPENPVGGVYAATVTVVDRVLDAASGTGALEITEPRTAFASATIRCKVQFQMHVAELTPASSGRFLNRMRLRHQANNR